MFNLKIMKIVIIEGPDNTGKTTVISRLMSQSKRAYYIHCQKPAANDPISAAIEQRDSFFKILEDIRELAKTDLAELVILDRSWVGEYVYGCKYRGNSEEFVQRMIQQCYSELADICVEHNSSYVTILLTTDDATFCALNEDGESISQGKVADIINEAERFNDICFKMQHIGNVHRIIVNDGLKFRDRDSIFKDVTTAINS